MPIYFQILSCKFWISSPDAVLLIASNPVDVMTQMVCVNCAKTHGTNALRIIGSGTILIRRFRALIAAHLGFSAFCSCLCAGWACGDSEVLHWSGVLVGTILWLILLRRSMHLLRSKLRSGWWRCGAAYRIIHGKGATWFGIEQVWHDWRWRLLVMKMLWLPALHPLQIFWVAGKCVCLIRVLSIVKGLFGRLCLRWISQNLICWPKCFGFIPSGSRNRGWWCRVLLMLLKGGFGQYVLNVVRLRFIEAGIWPVCFLVFGGVNPLCIYVRRLLWCFNKKKTLGRVSSVLFCPTILGGWPLISCWVFWPICFIGGFSSVFGSMSLLRCFSGLLVWCFWFSLYPFWGNFSVLTLKSICPCSCADPTRGYASFAAITIPFVCTWYNAGIYSLRFGMGVLLAVATLDESIKAALGMAAFCVGTIFPYYGSHRRKTLRQFFPRISDFISMGSCVKRYVADNYRRNTPAVVYWLWDLFRFSILKEIQNDNDNSRCSSTL